MRQTGVQFPAREDLSVVGSKEKAFDRVDHEYLLCTLRAFGFRMQFVAQIQLLYATTERLVKVNEAFPVVLWRRLSALVLRRRGTGVVDSTYASDVLRTFTNPADLRRTPTVIQRLKTAVLGPNVVHHLEDAQMCVGNPSARTPARMEFHVGPRVPYCSRDPDGKYAVCFLHKTHTSQGDKATLLLEWQGGVYMGHLTCKSGRVAILPAPHFQPAIMKVKERVPGHLLCLTVQLRGVWCFTSWTSLLRPRQMHFSDEVPAHFASIEKGQCIVLGGKDFNCILEDTGHSGAWSGLASERRLVGLVKSFELGCIWWNLHPDSIAFTFVQPGVRASRIDCLYISRVYASCIPAASMQQVLCTDHHLVWAELLLFCAQQESTYWHFNHKVLEDKQFWDLFHWFWTGWRWKQGALPSLRLWWDVDKANVLVFCQEYHVGGVRREEGRTTRSALRRVPGHVCEVADLAPPVPGLHLIVTGEKHLVLLADDGSLVLNPEGIRTQISAYYVALFSPDLSNKEAHGVLREDLSQLPPDTTRRLNAPTVFEELTGTLIWFSRGKYLGLDKLTVEFFRAFLDILGLEGGDYMQVLGDCLTAGELPLSWCIVVTDIGFSLASMLDIMIHLDQLYVILGQMIHINVYLVWGLIYVCHRTGQSGAFLSLDQEKAINRVVCP
eukprot:g39684.t1